MPERGFEALNQGPREEKRASASFELLTQRILHTFRRCLQFGLHILFPRHSPSLIQDSRDRSHKQTAR